MPTALKPYAMATVAEMQEVFPCSGASRDDARRACLNRASLEFEQELGRRVVFRAPVESATSIVASVAVAEGSTTPLSIAAAPTSPGRVLVITASGFVEGTLTVTGTVAGVAGTTEAFDLSLGISRQFGLKFFTAITSIVPSGVRGSGCTVAVGASVGYVDLFSPDGRCSELWLADYPAREILTVHEDTAREYGASTLLTSGTEYELAGDDSGRSRGNLRRIFDAAGSHRLWASSSRCVRVVHSAGYRIADVPATLKAECIALAQMYFEEGESNRLNIASISDDTGSRTRFARAGLTDEMRAAVAPFRAQVHQGDAERAWDQDEAA